MAGPHEPCARSSRRDRPCARGARRAQDASPQPPPPRCVRTQATLAANLDIAATAGLVFSGLAVGGTAAVVLPLAGRSAPKINM